jgi:hypothetical protein
VRGVLVLRAAAGFAESWSACSGMTGGGWRDQLALIVSSTTVGGALDRAGAISSR